MPLVLSTAIASCIPEPSTVTAVSRCLEVVVDEVHESVKETRTRKDGGKVHPQRGGTGQTLDGQGGNPSPSPVLCELGHSSYLSGLSSLSVRCGFLLRCEVHTGPTDSSVLCRP